MPDWRRLFARLQRLTGQEPPKRVPDEVVRKGYEPSDVNLRVVAAVTVLIIVLALFMHGALLLVLFGFAAREGERLPVPSPVPATARFPSPTLQVDPSADLARLRQDEGGHLSGYRWIDRSRGVVQIPIDRAMDLVVERGLPRRSPNAP